MDSLSGAIRACATLSTLPGGDEGYVLSGEEIAELAQRHSLPGHVVERLALNQAVHPLRYLRNMQSITAAEQIRLLDSTIAQVGLGGLGGTLLEIFLRTGVGTIRAADGDHFEESNLNRQALSKPDCLGQPKTEAARIKAGELNPSVDFHAVHGFLTPHDLPEFTSGADVVIDALGGLKTRLHLQQAAADAGIPLVTGALAGWTGYVGVVMPGQIGPADIMGQNNAAEEILGCPAPAVTLIASLMATEAVKLITDNAATLTGKMLVIDLETHTFETISL